MQPKARISLIAEHNQAEKIWLSRDTQNGILRARQTVLWVQHEILFEHESR